MKDLRKKQNRRMTKMDEDRIPEGVELPGDGNGPEDVGEIIEVDTEE